MGIEQYLMIASSTLRSDVLPTLPPSIARDQVVNCLRVLTRLAIHLQDNAAADADAQFGGINISPSIRAELAPLDGAALHGIAEEIAVDAATVNAMSGASAWLAGTRWWNDAEKVSTAKALLGWEARRRDARLSRLAKAETPSANNANDGVSGKGLTEATLADYLRKRFGEGIHLDSFRLLPGGRSRKSLMFRQQGCGDWPEWLVVQCDPPLGFNEFPGVKGMFPVLQYLHGNLNVPRPICQELDPEYFGTPFMIVERMPGSPPCAGIDFFAPPPPSEKLALSLARQIGKLHSLSPAPVAHAIPTMLPGDAGWQADLDMLTATFERTANGPSMTISAALAWMRANVDRIGYAQALVHGDLLQHNLLVDGDEVTALLDWEGARIAHPGEDLGYVRPMIEQMTSWERFMAAYREGGGQPFSREEADYFTLRAYIVLLSRLIHIRNLVEEGKVADIRAAEIGCSLIPQMIACIGATLNNVLRQPD